MCFSIYICFKTQYYFAKINILFFLMHFFNFFYHLRFNYAHFCLISHFLLELLTFNLAPCKKKNVINHLVCKKCCNFAKICTISKIWSFRNVGGFPI